MGLSLDGSNFIAKPLCGGHTGMPVTPSPGLRQKCLLEFKGNVGCIVQCSKSWGWGREGAEEMDLQFRSTKFSSSIYVR